MRINNLKTAIHANTVDKGFVKHGDRRPVAEHVALIVTEVGELYEDHRDGLDPDDHWYKNMDGSLSRSPLDEEYNILKPVGIPSEVADIIIRALDFAAEHGIDVELAIAEKMRYNATRPHKHGRQS